MVPIEYYFAIIGIFIVLVTLTRGYASQLGNTLVFLVAIFILSVAEPYSDRVVDAARGLLPNLPSESDAVNQLLCLAYIGIFTAIVFASYAGRTFEYGGEQAPPPQGTLLNIGIGLLNGYLVAGTYWYYFHRYEYPFEQIQLPLSPLAQSIVTSELLPEQLFDSPALWMVPVAILILLRIRG
ncbi:MAG: hypothetical protein AAF702_09010 [Chloroflexota bacterium]